MTNSKVNHTVLITGATSGIGQAAARKFAASGWNLILTGRREDRLKSLSDEIQQEHNINIRTLTFDVRDLAEVDRAMNQLESDEVVVDVLLNNAGLAVGKNTFQEGVIDDWERMIDTNIKGLMYMSRKVVPWMVNRGSGHIINVGSTAGKEVYPGGNVYCATKFAVDALTKGMRIDLLPHGIKVSQIAPGMVETEFSLVRFKGDVKKADQVYQGFQPLRSEDVAEVIHYMATLPPHVCMNDVVLTATAQANSYLTYKE